MNKQFITYIFSSVGDYENIVKFAQHRELRSVYGYFKTLLYNS